MIDSQFLRSNVSQKKLRHEISNVLKKKIINLEFYAQLNIFQKKGEIKALFFKGILILVVYLNKYYNFNIKNSILYIPIFNIKIPIPVILIINILLGYTC